MIFILQLEPCIFSLKGTYGLHSGFHIQLKASNQALEVGIFEHICPNILVCVFKRLGGLVILAMTLICMLQMEELRCLVKYFGVDIVSCLFCLKTRI